MSRREGVLFFHSLLSNLQTFRGDAVECRVLHLGIRQNSSVFNKPVVESGPVQEILSIA